MNYLREIVENKLKVLADANTIEELENLTD